MNGYLIWLLDFVTWFEFQKSYQSPCRVQNERVCDSSRSVWQRCELVLNLI